MRLGNATFAPIWFYWQSCRYLSNVPVDRMLLLYFTVDIEMKKILSIAVLVDESVALKKYLYYYFLKNNLRYLDSGSAQSQITIGDLKNVEVPLPSIETQKKVVSILDVIDEKINNNVAINDNLADLLQTIYQDRFGNDILAVNQGVLSDICSYSRDKVAVSELNVSTYFSTENMLSEKAGSTEATSLPTTSQTTACHKGDTLISNIRPYFKKIVYCEGNCGCSTDIQDTRRVSSVFRSQKGD